MIKAIIFDCFGVLTTDLWKEFVHCLPEELRIQASSLNRAYDSGLLTRQEFLEEIEALTGRRPAEVESLLTHEIEKNTPLLEFIAELKTKYKIGLLSNIASDWIKTDFLTEEEQQLFDAMVFSYQVGAAKPDAKMFETAAERLDVPPQECVMIDDIERYCAAAEDTGMKAINYVDFTQMKRDLENILAK